MRARFHALARTGRLDGEPETITTVVGTKPVRPALAGSRHVWFEDVNIRGADGAWDYLCAFELDEAMRAHLSALRPAVCGLSLDRPRIMGIVNVTPDSFSDGGDRLGVADALAAAQAMAAEGADLLDIGGESTRPGAETVAEHEEIARVVPVIEAIRDAGIATPISIDTRKAVVAEAALAAGADMVNDVSAMTYDPEIAAVVAQHAVPVCLMHAQGDPATMQDAPRYDDVRFEVFDRLEARIAAAVAAGIPKQRILADPGIGFGKTLKHNLTLLRILSLYHNLGVPLLVGASRKRFIGTIGGADSAKDRMPGSLAVALHAAAQGAQILRVHDVKETRQALDLHLALNGDEWDDT
ncbi:dihydropteroate synthase [Psychromarinibacter sp. C21-152]|uniref:Dihydropteroate synthase n=1 Tax=Psychromarinibacter sediminicola TaxID=3033385 RepID=A0AAE3NR88_9RHOB|nr:dihydropteroate synthase [Psychromarinibacter sediminicola]MDF0601009.1 dihydropteroate synthase [Psychromarinibacter sediminicola]